jgi:hypothetical protein
MFAGMSSRRSFVPGMFMDNLQTMTFTMFGGETQNMLTALKVIRNPHSTSSEISESVNEYKELIECVKDDMIARRKEVYESTIRQNISLSLRENAQTIIN